MNLQKLIETREALKKQVFYYRLDIILLNPELRREAVARIKKYNINLWLLCEKYGINYKELRLFLVTKNPLTWKVYSFLHWDFIILLGVLGIEVKVIGVSREPNLEGVIFNENTDRIKKYKDNQRAIDKAFFEDDISPIE